MLRSIWNIITLRDYMYHETFGSVLDELFEAQRGVSNALGTNYMRELSEGGHSPRGFFEAYATILTGCSHFLQLVFLGRTARPVIGRRIGWSNRRIATVTVYETVAFTICGCTPAQNWRYYLDVLANSAPDRKAAKTIAAAAIRVPKENVSNIYMDNLLRRFGYGSDPGAYIVLSTTVASFWSITTGMVGEVLQRHYGRRRTSPIGHDVVSGRERGAT
jgi:hypothetical protein